MMLSHFLDIDAAIIIIFFIFARYAIFDAAFHASIISLS